MHVDSEPVNHTRAVSDIQKTTIALGESGTSRLGSPDRRWGGGLSLLEIPSCNENW